MYSYMSMQKKTTKTTAETIKETDNTSFTVLYNIFKKSVDHSDDRSEIFDCQFCKTILGSKLLGFSFLNFIYLFWLFKRAFKTLQAQRANG